jgi:hypothetical protein
MYEEIPLYTSNILVVRYLISCRTLIKLLSIKIKLKGEIEIEERLRKKSFWMMSWEQIDIDNKPTGDNIDKLFNNWSDYR